MLCLYTLPGYGFRHISLSYICSRFMTGCAFCAAISALCVCVDICIPNVLGHEFPYAIHLSSARNDQAMDSNTHVQFVIRRRQRSVEPSSTGKHSTCITIHYTYCALLLVILLTTLSDIQYV